jgi:antitoxin component YwqK of YwqJK toxin-antitoxin module
MTKINLVERWVNGTDNLLQVFYEDEKGQKQGCYIEFYPGTARILNIQRYVDNMRNGRSFIINPDKETSSIIYYKDNLRHGFGRYFFKYITPSEIYCYYHLDMMEGERIEI